MRRSPYSSFPLLMLGGFLGLGGCTTHTVRVEPVEVKPIHVTMDINLRVQKELSNFFEFEEKVKGRLESDASSQELEPNDKTDTTQENP